MFREVQVTNLDRPDLSPLTLSLFGEEEYLIKFIDGLNPAPATLVSSEYAFLHGAKFQNSKTQTRNIVMTLGFSPSWADGRDYTYLRRGLYPYFSTETNVELVFTTDDDRDLRITGYVETHESDIFVKKPLSQISIVCMDPYFRVEEPIVETKEIFNGVAQFNIDYEGDEPTGFELSYDIKSTNRQVEIRHTAPDGEISYIKYEEPDVLNWDNIKGFVSTVPGEKRLTLNEDGTGSSKLDLLTVDSTWPKIYPGSNTITYTTDNSPSGDANGSVTVSYYELHGGL